MPSAPAAGGLIVTGGFAPCQDSFIIRFAARHPRPEAGGQAPPRHRGGAQTAGGKIALQILHRPLRLSPAVRLGPSKCAINPFTPRALSNWGIRRTIGDYARCAQLAQKAGYTTASRSWAPGLPDQPVHRAADQPTHRPVGRPVRNRIRLAVEIVKRDARQVGPNFIIIFRLSMLDLVEGGSSWDEVVAAGEGHRGGRRDHHQYRHRLARSAHPDHRDHGAARRLRW